MNPFRIVQWSIAVLLLAYMPVSIAGPHYANDESKRVVEAMVKAHGGLDKWRAAPSIRFDNVMHNNYHGKNEFAWWVAHEVIDQKTRQVWQDWPMDDARIGYDGEEVWSVDWERGNPSPSMVHFFYYFVNLPWLSQDDGVILSEPTRFVWPETEEELYEVRMTYEKAPGIGKSEDACFHGDNDSGAPYAEAKLAGSEYRGISGEPLVGPTTDRR